MVGRQGDAALGIGMLLIGAGGQAAQERSGSRIASRCLARPAGQLLEFRSRVDGKAVILALGDHQPPCQRVAELGGQRQSPLVVELGRVGADKHLLTSYGDWLSPRPNTSATIPHNPPL